MIKVTCQLVHEKNIAEIIFEASSADDLPKLDMIHAAFMGPYPLKSGFISSDKLVFQAADINEPAPTLPLSNS